jgi:hypothetical protein
MSRTCIITSAAYLDVELETEFGRLPPSFLPIGNRRLFVRQRELVKSSFDRVILSLPDDFVPDPGDKVLLDSLNIETVQVPVGLTLGESIVYVINVTASSGGELAILHGDTVLTGLDHAQSDIISVADAPSGYRWGRVYHNGQTLASATYGPLSEESADGDVLSGWFAFSDAVLLVQSITRSGGDFLGGLGTYGAVKPLSAVRAADWLDFGHASTYHQSRRRITTEREFNTLAPTRRAVVKSGRNSRKIEAEGNWFANLPPAVRLYTPAFLGSTSDGDARSYSIEYLYLATLSDLFVFGRLSPQSWRHIFFACNEFLEACSTIGAPAGTEIISRTLYADKTMSRLEEFARSSGLDLSTPCRIGGTWLPSLEHMVKIAADAIPVAKLGQLTFTHGDFCLSNILYDPRSDMIRVIDPRGMTSNGDLSSYGDLRYDLGKLYHSIVGRYDHIIAGYYHLRVLNPLDLVLELPGGPQLKSIESEFRQQKFAGMSVSDAASHAITILLFFAMLPLHSDDSARQNALLANGMRLFSELDAGLAER